MLNVTHQQQLLANYSAVSRYDNLQPRYEKQMLVGTKQ